ncbi:MAG TPA: hypothetical protein VIM11_04180 [Tepidisphaeraceae bacterium]|jgi:hypothetical protein
MALLRFGNFAVEWSRLYAMHRVATDKLFLYVDAPHLPSGQPTAPTLTVPQIDQAWRQAMGDRHFAIFGNLAIDKARICAVSLDEDGVHGNLGFELSANRGVNLRLPAEVISIILKSVPEPKNAGYPIAVSGP